VWLGFGSLRVTRAKVGLHENGSKPECVGLGPRDMCGLAMVPIGLFLLGF
jgi:hypothetical protein